MSNEDLFIIIKALLWYLPTIQVPSDEELKYFIEVHRGKENE